MGLNDNNLEMNGQFGAYEHITSTNVDGKTASFSTNKKRSNCHKNEMRKDKSHTIMSDLTNK